MLRLFAVLALLFLPVSAFAQDKANVVATCGTPNSTYTRGQNQPLTQDTSGLLCNGVSLTPSGTQDVNIIQTGGVTQLRGAGATGTGSERVTVAIDSATIAGSAPILTLVTLDIKTVTTGGTAVAALSAGHRNRGGWLQNPKGATIDLCINEIGTATGTTSSGDTTCITPGASYTLAPSGNAVSVITSDSSHPYSGMGFN